MRLKNALSNSRQCAIIPNSVRANGFFVGPRHVARSEFAVVEILIQTLNRRDSIVTRNRVPGECAGQISCKSDLNLSSPLSRDNLHPLLLLPSSSSSTKGGKGADTNTSHLSREKSSFVSVRCKRSIEFEQKSMSRLISFFVVIHRSGKLGGENFSDNNFEYDRSLAIVIFNFIIRIYP